MTAWTEENVATLTKHWEEGMSAAKIAQKLPDTTRNAVIGKAQRLGLSKHRRAKGQNQPRVRSPKTRFLKQPEAELLEFQPPTDPGIPFMGANGTTCRAIVGRGDDGLALFCSNPRVPDSGDSWCPFHCSVYYNPLARRG